MYTVIRSYSGSNAKKLADLLVEHKREVEGLLRSVTGLVSYTAAQTTDGAVTITVCEDKAGGDESVKIARDWVAKRGASLSLGSPSVSEGEVVIHLK